MEDDWDKERPGWRLGVLQLKALLWRQYLLKKRSSASTIVELLSPIVLVSLLVIAYTQVTPDHFPAKIYVEETAEALRNLTTPFQQFSPPTLRSNCSDLMHSMAEAGESGGDGWQPSTADIAAVESCLGEVTNVNTSFTTAAVSAAAVKLLQAFIDSNGPIPVPTLDEFVLLHKLLQTAVQSDPSILGLLRGAKRSFGWNVLGNLVDMGKLAFAPATPEVLKLAAHLRSSHELFADVFHGVFRTESDAEDYISSETERLWALVVFNSGPSAAGSEYTIRMNFTTVPRTWVPINRWRHDVSIHYKEYYTSGFLSLQAAIDAYTLGLPASLESSLDTGPADSATPLPAPPQAWTAWGSVFPTSEYEHNDFYDAVGPILGLLMSLSLVYPLSMLVRGLVEEREKRRKETMCIMGLQGWVLHAAWMITYALILLVICVALTIVCCTSFLRATNPLLLFMLFVFFAASELAFGLMVAAFFNNAKIAGIVAPLAHFACLLPRYIFFRAEAPQAIVGKVFVSLLSPSAFTFAADLIGEYEGSGEGLQWSNLWSDPFPMGAIFIMLAADAKLYSLLAWYLEKVLPSPYGARLPWWFPFSRSYWATGDVEDGLHAMAPVHRMCSRLKKLLRLKSGQDDTAAYQQVDLEGDSSVVGMEAPADVESRDASADEAGPPALAQTTNLQKVYGQHVAVHNLSLRLRVGEVTALLGHNGAGKTTAVGMLTGLLRPTAGTCTVMGHDVLRAAAHARQHIGYCPQANVLFGSLTVWEHLLLFCAIKGISGGAFSRAAEAASSQIMEAVGLQDKRNCKADALSGGMKRKLQVALALLGSSKVILLDEPTSGVDPSSRRALWTILSRYKKGRAMLLTTHFMDEADLLSDSIAIMAEGRLRCWGPSLLLKQQYSSGYTLTMNTSLRTDVPPDRAAIHRLLLSHIPSAKILRTSGAELVYRLPMEWRGRFADMLEQLEAQSSTLGVTHYAVTMPTLEEVFLRCTAESHQQDSAANSSDGHCTVTLTPQAKQPAALCSNSASETIGSSEQASSGSTHAALPSGAAAGPNRATGGREQGEFTGGHAASPSGDDMGSSSAEGSSSPASSDGDGSDGGPAGRVGESLALPLPISRDDSAEALSSTLVAVEEPRSEQGKTPDRSSQGAGTSRHHSQVDTPLTKLPSVAAKEECNGGQGLHAGTDGYVEVRIDGAGEAGCAEEELEDVPLHEHVPKPRSPAKQWRVAFREMLRKRAIIAGRDKKGLLFQLLLPVAAICLVLAILKVNIDPSSPTITLDFTDMLQQQPVYVANAPPGLSPCIVKGTASAQQDPGPCHNGLHFRPVAANDSLQLSQLLLQDRASGAAAQYGALVFNDSVIRHIPDAFSGLNMSTASLGTGDLLNMLPLLSSVLPFRLPSAGRGQLIGGLLPQLTTPESRVVSRLIRRFQDNPGVMLLHNSSSYHSLPALLSGLHQSLGALEVARTGNASAAAPIFTVNSHPLPLTSEESVKLDSLLTVLAALFVLVPLCYLSGAFTINPVVEEASQAHHLQLLSGCPPFIYWAGTYVWDAATYVVVALLALGVFAAYGDRATVGSTEQAAGTLALLLAYGAAVIPLAYCYSFAFASPSAAQVSVAALSFTLGFVAVTGSYVMRLIPKTQALQAVLVHFFRVQPPFLLGEGLIELTRYNFERDLARARFGADGASAGGASASDSAVEQSTGGQMDLGYGSVMDWDTLGRSLALLALEAVFYFALALWLDRQNRHRTSMCSALRSCFARSLGAGKRWLKRVLRGRDGRGEYAQVGAGGDGNGAVQMTDLEGMGTNGSAGNNGGPHDWDEEAQALVASVDPPQAAGEGAVVAEDEDVAAERERVMSGDAAGDSLCLRSLRKVYEGDPPKVAVHDLCLGVPPGERFGLLGPNGAGKTTTLALLTGRAHASGGDALVNGVSVMGEAEPASRALLGFCPQQDPLLELLTAREHLALFARLKGVEEAEVAAEVERVLARVALPAEMAARAAGQYSGGSRRKLALGIALVGGVDAVLLDEPSSGMDPGARRAMWSFIIEATSASPGSNSRADGLAVVLTTHSMEECEALCTRVGIMHQGRLRCLGSSSHLKLRFGGGYLLDVHAADDEGVQARLAAFIARELGGAPSEDRHFGRAKFRLPVRGQAMARVFRVMEAARAELGVQAYGLSMPTLEQVFLSVVGENLQG
ncbi:g2604 [Coccomyxa elongata]